AARFALSHHRLWRPGFSQRDSARVRGLSTEHYPPAHARHRPRRVGPAGGEGPPRGNVAGSPSALRRHGTSWRGAAATVAGVFELRGDVEAVVRSASALSSIRHIRNIRGGYARRKME